MAAIEKVNEIVTNAVQGLTGAFTYGNEQAQGISTGAGLRTDDRTATDVVQQRGGEMMDTGMVAAGELKDRAAESAGGYYDSAKGAAGQYYEQGKEKAGQLYEQGKENAGAYAEQAKEKAGEYYDSAKDAIAQKTSDARDKFSEDTRAMVQDVRFYANDKSGELSQKAQDVTEGIKEDVSTKAESMKEYIGNAMESLKESILHGDQQAHAISTGQGLLEGDTSDKATSFKESAKETLEDLTGRVFDSSAQKAGAMAEKTDDIKDSLKANVDEGADHLKAMCEDAEMKLNDAASTMEV